jgi:hypothetical protein
MNDFLSAAKCGIFVRTGKRGAMTILGVWCKYLLWFYIYLQGDANFGLSCCIHVLKFWEDFATSHGM